MNHSSKIDSSKRQLAESFRMEGFEYASVALYYNLQGIASSTLLKLLKLRTLKG